MSKQKQSTRKQNAPVTVGSAIIRITGRQPLVLTAEKSSIDGINKVTIQPKDLFQLSSIIERGNNYSVIGELNLVGDSVNFTAGFTHPDDEPFVPTHNYRVVDLAHMLDGLTISEAIRILRDCEELIKETHKVDTFNDTFRLDAVNYIEAGAEEETDLY